eukprot:764491-Hanusia_phi.AAC.2
MSTLDQCNPNSPYQGVIASERPTICMWDSKNPGLQHARLPSPSPTAQEASRPHMAWKEAKPRMADKIYLENCDFIPSGKASPIPFSTSWSPLAQGSMRSGMLEPACSGSQMENTCCLRAEGCHESCEQRYLWHLAPHSPSSVVSNQVNILEMINDYTRKKCWETANLPPLQFQSDHLNVIQDISTCEIPDLDFNMTSGSMLDVTQERSQHMINLSAMPEAAGHVGDGLIKRVQAAYEAVMEDVDCQETTNVFCEDVVCRSLLSPIVETVKRAVEISDREISGCDEGGMNVSCCSPPEHCDDGMVGYLKKIVTRSIDHKRKITEELKTASEGAENTTERLESLLMQAKAYRKSVDVLSHDIMSRNQDREVRHDELCMKIANVFGAQIRSFQALDQMEKSLVQVCAAAATSHPLLLELEKWQRFEMSNRFVLHHDMLTANYCQQRTWKHSSKTAKSISSDAAILHLIGIANRSSRTSERLLSYSKDADLVDKARRSARSKTPHAEEIEGHRAC